MKQLTLIADSDTDVDNLYNEASDIIITATRKSNYEKLNVHQFYNKVEIGSPASLFNNTISQLAGESIDRTEDIAQPAAQLTYEENGQPAAYFELEKIGPPAAQSNKVIIDSDISWSHYRELLKIVDNNEIIYYMRVL